MIAKHYSLYYHCGKILGFKRRKTLQDLEDSFDDISRYIIDETSLIEVYRNKRNECCFKLYENGQLIKKGGVFLFVMIFHPEIKTNKDRLDFILKHMEEFQHKKLEAEKRHAEFEKAIKKINKTPYVNEDYKFVEPKINEQKKHLKNYEIKLVDYIKSI